MIKPEELRIGDYVRVSSDNCMIPKGALCEVVAIDSERTCEDKKGLAGLLQVVREEWEFSHGVWCDYIEGILLTPDILEKNGFEMREDTVVYAKNRFSLKPLDDEKGYQVGLGSLHFFYVKVKIVKYVHEFQHILWALGEDANLKI